MRPRHVPGARSKLVLPLLMAAAALWAAEPARARELVDATGARVELKEHPRRVVTLAPSLGELAADLAPDASVIVGVSEYTDYPPALRKRPTIGPYHRFNLERVLALKPDLVLATLDGNAKDQVLHLRQLGLPVVTVASTTLAEVLQSVTLAAEAMGEAKRGLEIRSQLERGIARIRERAKARASRPKVLLQLGEDPLIVVGSKSFLHEAISTVGAVNAFGDLDAGYPRPSIEEVIRRDPDQIIVLTLSDAEATFRKMAAGWSSHPQLKAVKSKQVQVLRADGLLRPSLRLLEGLAQLERAVFGPVPPAPPAPGGGR